MFFTYLYEVYKLTGLQTIKAERVTPPPKKLRAQVSSSGQLSPEPALPSTGCVDTVSPAANGLPDPEAVISAGGSINHKMSSSLSPPPTNSSSSPQRSETPAIPRRITRGSLLKKNKTRKQACIFPIPLFFLMFFFRSQFRNRTGSLVWMMIGGAHFVVFSFFWGGGGELCLYLVVQNVIVEPRPIRTRELWCHP
jgi:hypothetical protein